MPGGCVTNALPINDGLEISLSPDVWHMRDALQGWLAKQAKEGGVAVVELPMGEEDEEEDWRREFSMAGGVVPLQAPEPVKGGPCGLVCGSLAKVPGRRGGGSPAMRRPGGRHLLWSRCPQI